MSDKQPGLSLHDRLQALALQFRGLEGHPALWPAAPRTACRAAAALLVVACGWWWMWTAQWDALAAGNAEEEKQKIAFQTKLAQARSLNELRHQKQLVEQQVVKLERQLPNKAEMDALLSDINQAGISRGLQFELFKPGTSGDMWRSAETSFDGPALVCASAGSSPEVGMVWQARLVGKAFGFI